MSPATFTTDLPDAQGLQLDASIENEMTATWTDVLNNGEFHLELKDVESDGSGSYVNEATVGQNTTSHTITGLLDGNKYSVRLRTQTAYKTGSWLAAEEITKFPAPDGLTVTSTSPTSISLEWSEYANAESGSKIFRARMFDDVVESFEQIGTTGADDTTFVDDGVLPQREYRYYAREYTEWVFADTGNVDATADATGKPTTRIPAQDWYVEVDHPSGTTHKPSVLDDGAQVVPKVNGLPRVRIPVAKSEKWQADAFEKAPVRVWKDGDRQPAVVLLDVEQQPGRTVLVTRAGEALRERVEAEYDNVPVPDIVEELVTQETDYATNIDPPEVEQFTNTVLDVDTGSEIVDALNRDAATPFVARDGDLQLAQTAFSINTGDPDQVSYSGEDHDGDDNIENGTEARADNYTGGFARALSALDATVTSNTFELEYDIPAEEVGLALRWAWDSPPTDIQISLLDADNGTAVGSVTMATIDSDVAVAWDFDDTSSIGSGWDDGTIPAGEYELEVKALESVDGATIVDMVTLFDRRFHDPDTDFDNSTHEAEGHLDSPAEHPTEASVWTDILPTVLSVIGGIVDVTIDDTTGNQAIGVTNDGDDALVTASNTDKVTADFAERTGELQAQLTLSATEPSVRNDQTPRYGYESQRVSELTITGEFDDMPLALNWAPDDRLINLLRELAEQLSDSVFSVDVQDDGTGVIEWAQREQRTTAVDASLADFELTTVRDPIDRAIVYGSSQTARREAFEAAHGTAVTLEHERLLEGSVDVYDPDSQDSFEEGDDYEISHRDGTITALADGDLADGTVYRADYEHQTRGVYTAEGVADSEVRNTEVADISGLTTDRACGQAARRIVQTGKQPRHELTATWPGDVDLPPVTNALEVEGLPVDVAIQTNQVEATPTEIVTTGGSRRPVEDVIDEISSRISSISRRV